MPLVKMACEKRTKFFPSTNSSLSGQFIGQISKNAMTHISIFQAKSLKVNQQICHLPA